MMSGKTPMNDFRTNFPSIQTCKTEFVEIKFVNIIHVSTCTCKYILMFYFRNKESCFEY